VITDREALEDFFSRPDRALCLMDMRDYSELRDDHDLPLSILEKGSIGHREIALVARREFTGR
jgi:hypothetical protein